MGSRQPWALPGALLCLLTAHVLAPAPAAAERLFATPYVPLQTPASAHQVAIADITGDGAVDIVWLGTGSFSDPYDDPVYWNAVGSFLGPSADGTLANGRGASLGSEDYPSPASMAVGDLNGDGRSDVVVMEDLQNSDESRKVLWVALGSATPAGFMFHSSIAVPWTNAPPAIGDLNRDGKPDVALATADSVLTFIGDGTGGLTPGPGIACRSSIALAVGDVNGDGRSDIVVVADGSVDAFVAAADGSFDRWASRWAGGNAGRIQLVDINNDGRPDLVVSGGVLLGDGAGGFDPELRHGTDGPFAAGDFNGDGRLDLAVTSSGLSVLLGKGDGTFTLTRTYDIRASDVAVGDLDEDGHLDLSLATGSIADLFGDGDGTFGHDIASYPVDDGARALVAGDVNGDGRADVAVLNEGSSTVSLLLSTQAGTFLPKLSLATGAVPQDLVLKDFDGDRSLDLAVAQPEARRVAIFGGHGDGTFGPSAVIPMTGKPQALASGDLDEDGFLDLAVSLDNGVFVFFGGPSGVPASGRLVNAIPSPSRGGWPFSGGGQIVVADFTGDGHLDIGRLGNDIDFVAGNGDGTFGSPLGVWADHDNDGGYAGPLVTVANGCSDQVFTSWYCCGCTHCGDENSLRMVLGPGCDEDGCPGDGYRRLNDVGLPVQVGDLNGDGTDDLVTSGGFALLGPGFGSQQWIVPGSADMAVGDANRDAKLDLFVLRRSSHPPYRSVEVYVNQSARPTIPQSPRNLEAVSGGASIGLSWDPVLYPGLAGYRVRYGVGPGEAHAGTEASEGSSPIEVPAGQTSLTLHCLPESTFWVKITALDGLGRESTCPRPVSARPGPVGGDFSFMGGSLNAASQGRWVMGLVQLDPGMSAAHIVPGTVMVNGIGPADPLGVTDRDHDGRSELMIRFPRTAVQGSGGPVRVEGRVAGCRDTLSFAVDDSIRVRKPGAQPQAGAEDGLEGDRSVIAFALHPVAPSPASAGCTIAFDLPEPAAVRLSVFDLRGRLMSTVLDGDMPAGAHRVWWKRQSLPDGVYFARIEAGRFRAVRTIVLIR